MHQDSSQFNFKNNLQIARSANIHIEATRRGAKLKRVGQEWIGPCPICGGTDRFAINQTRALFNCRRCRRGGDVIALVQHLDGCTFTEAVACLIGLPVRDVPGACGALGHKRASVTANGAEPNLSRAVQTWSEARDPRGTLAQTYLLRRGVEVPSELAGEVIRFHDSLFFDGAWLPGLVALFRDVVTDQPRAIQRVFLLPDGRRIGRRMLGPVKGAVIKLDADAEVTHGLHIGEGLETCMAARSLGFKPVWAVGSAGGIRTFPVLPGIEALSIFLETDDHCANERAARACAIRWLEASREVLAIAPLLVGDMNDVARRCANVG